jgi:acetolactate synthase regulatory subunit
MGLFGRLFGRGQSEQSETTLGGLPGVSTSGPDSVHVTTTNVGQSMGIKDSLELAHDLQSALKQAMESGNMTMVSGSGVIDARNNPELRKQILDTLSGHGIDITAIQAAAAHAAMNVPGATPAHAEDLLLDQLSKLGELKASGVLTQQEFDAQKAKLLKRPAS